MIARTLMIPIFLTAGFAAAQIPGPTATPASDAGVARAVLLDDVRFHLFLPISGAIEFTKGTEKTAAVPGQVFYMDKGTPHGFRNTGTSVAMAFEVFIRDGAPSAQNLDEIAALALAFASIPPPSRLEKK